MKKIFGATVMLAAMALLVTSADAAIRILRATIAHGQVEVSGFNAPPRQPIYWEGDLVGVNSHRFGIFAFNTAELPPDCVGRLKIGSEERAVVIRNCTPTPITVIEGGVAKTGQTTSFAAGDDGDLEKGTASPNPRFTNNLNGTITDNLTGLIWLQDASCLGAQDWLNALAAANKLAHGNVACGLSDGSVAGAWRLPNRNELTSLLDLGMSNPALPSGHPFTHFELSTYWSSTTVAGSETSAWIVSFDFGGVNSNGKSGSGSHFVTAVRGGS